MMNASIAIASMEQIMGGSIEKAQYERWSRAIAEVTWEGRMEEVLPGVYLDGAHNPGAVTAFCESVLALDKEMYREENNKQRAYPVILFSAVDDKEYEVMAEELCRRIPAKAYVVTEVFDRRRVPARKLAEIFRKYTDRPVFERADLHQAWETALACREGQGKVYCLGSLYLAGMVKEEILAD